MLTSSKCLNLSTKSRIQTSQKPKNMLLSLSDFSSPWEDPNQHYLCKITVSKSDQSKKFREKSTIKRDETRRVFSKNILDRLSILISTTILSL
jgi:hypothetical protein